MELCLFSQELSMSFCPLSKELGAGYLGSRSLSCLAVFMPVEISIS